MTILFLSFICSLKLLLTLLLFSVATLLSCSLYGFSPCSYSVTIQSPIRKVASSRLCLLISGSRPISARFVTIQSPIRKVASSRLCLLISGSRPVSARFVTIQSPIRKVASSRLCLLISGSRPIETIAQAALSEQAPSVSLHNCFCMALNSYIVLYFAESVNTTCSGENSAAIASATRMPSMAAEVMPPAYPAPSPQG